MKASANIIKVDAIEDALISGTNASVLSAVVLSACSKLEEDSAAGALNGPSQWVWGEREAYTREATLKHTVVGYGVHHVTSVFWALFYEHLFGRSRKRDLASQPVVQIAAEAGATATVAYFVDYQVAPKRLRPGFKKHLGPVSIFASYAGFAAGLAITTLARRKASISRGMGESRAGRSAG